MIGMQYNLPSKGVLEVSGFASSEAKSKKEVSCASNEPISVLDTMRSPSPSTSTSTLSSFGGSGNGGGGGSTDNKASLAAVSDINPHQKWPISLPPETGSGSVSEPSGGGGDDRKDEWAAELQPIPTGLEVGSGSSQRFGLGLEDWESLLSESVSSPGQDQPLLRWITGDVDDTSYSMKQLFQGGNLNEIDGNVATGVIDQSSSFEPSVTGGSSNGNLLTSLSSSLGFLGSGSSVNNSNTNGKLGSGSLPNSSGSNSSCRPQNPSFSSPTNTLPSTHGMTHQQFANPDQKPQIFRPQVMMYPPAQVQSTANPNMLNSLLYNTEQEQHQFQPQPKRHNSGIMNSSTQISKPPFVDPGHEFLLRKQQQLPQMQQPQLGLANQLNLTHRPHHQQQQITYDQLYKAAELILAGNFVHAQAILARLNHQLSPIEKPFQRAAFYFKEALQLPLFMPNPITSLPTRFPTPYDGMFKMDAYKMFSEVSPLIQFINFTSNQALLDAFDDTERVHIIDFDIGCGAQWVSLMQELPRGKSGAPSLKITAFASPTTHHPIELGLIHESLTQYAHETGVIFELEVVNFDTFDPNSYSLPPSRSSENEAIAVNFPNWSLSSHLSSLPSLLRFIKNLSPKVLVLLDSGCERTELPFSQHLLHALQYFEVLLDSIDAANVTSDTANKIERFLFQPRIENMVLGRLHFPEQMPHWKTLFASAGFTPVAMSNFAETQAECVVKRTQVRGFHVEKRQLSLVLCWQHRELMSASAWRC